MGQEEVNFALKNLRKINSNWHTSKSIVAYMKNNKLLVGNVKAIYNDLLRLATFDMIEVRGVGLWKHHKEFRGLKE